MWEEELSPELNTLFDDYFTMLGGYPDEYDQIVYSSWTEQEFIEAIKISLQKKRELPDIL